MKAVRWEVEMGRRFTKILALSEEDRAVIKTFLPDKDVGYVKHGTCVAEYDAPYREIAEKSLIFIGSYHHYPNRDAVLYFHRKIWPLIKRRHPEASWKIVGSHADSEIQSLGNEPGIAVVGFVPDVRPHVRDAMIFIAPMRKGRGMKGKVLEAMAMAKPVVTTSIGAQGAEVVPGEHLLTGDTPSAFADAVNRLFAEPELRKRLALAGQKLVREEYDWRRAAEEMDRLYRRILD
jgi:glycosyltransferase involved in cell wall biosynthesis